MFFSLFSNIFFPEQFEALYVPKKQRDKKKPKQHYTKLGSSAILFSNKKHDGESINSTQKTIPKWDLPSRSGKSRTTETNNERTKLKNPLRLTP